MASALQDASGEHPESNTITKVSLHLYHTASVSEIVSGSLYSFQILDMECFNWNLSIKDILEPCKLSFI